MRINESAYRYSYGRLANKSLKDIEIPDVVPVWVNHTKITPITTKLVDKKLILNFQNWEEFKMERLFDFKKGKRLTKEDMYEGNTIFLGAISENNGVRQK